MSDIKKLIQAMDAIESKKNLTESAVVECGGMPAPAPENPGNPVTVSINFNASGKDNVADLLDMLKNAGLQPEGPAPMPTMPMRMDIEKFRDVVDNGDKPGTLTHAIQNSSIEEAVDPTNLMGEIRKMAKAVETSPDEREHRIFAQQVESNLIDLYQHFNQQQDAEKQQVIKNLIKQNKAAQTTTNRRNANDIVSALWELMQANEGYANEPDEQYSDHKLMTKDLSGGINRPKKMYKPAAPGDNPMAVESIKDRLFKELNEKKAKPDFLDMDKDGNKKEPMKKAVADKKKVKEAAKPDFLDMDKDGNKKEPMKKAVADKKKAPFKSKKKQ